jgi:LCP family protein required for cell wall assembly
MMKKQKILFILAGMIMLIVGLGVFGFVNEMLKSDAGSNTSGSYENGSEGSSNSKEANSSLIDVLNDNNEELFQKIDTRKTVIFGIYGTDERTTDDTGRSDIIIVVMYDPTIRKLTMVSLPRDLKVDIPGYGMDKINHAFAYGGKALTDRTIEDLLGIRLDFSIKADFDTFAKIIDAVGGVHINAQKNFYDGDKLIIKAGEQIINGSQALTYVRFRSDSDGDYGRIARQQEVIISLIDSLKSRSYEQLVKLIETYYNRGIQTDASLAKIKEYISMSNQDNTITYEAYRLPTYSVLDGLWYELYNQEDLDAIKSLFTNNQEKNLENWK